MKKTKLENFFNVSIFLKLIHGIVEIIGGLILFFVSTSSVANFFRWIFAKELREDSKDFFVNSIINIAQNLSFDIKSFIGIYFIVLGVINFWIAFILLTKKIKHYIFVEAILIMLLIYEIYSFVQTYSLLILSLIIIDSIILILIFKYHKFLLKNS